jgi:hypothetical protein
MCQEEFMKLHRTLTLLAALALTAGLASADPFDGILDRLGSAVGERTQQLGEKAIDGTYDHADKAMDCTVGDKECARKANTSTVARCTATDTACLKAASAAGQKVEIVPEAASDTVECKISDTACLQQAQKAGKKVAVVQ